MIENYGNNNSYIHVKNIFFPIILVPIFLISSCSIRQNPPSVSLTGSVSIDSLQTEIKALKTENANLKEEISLLRAGGSPESVTTTMQSGTSLLGNDGLDYTEGSLDSCLQEAFRAFVRSGNEACQKRGYSETDIQANRCQLEKSIIAPIEEARTKAENNCKSLYQ